MVPTVIVDRLLADEPVFHSGGTRIWTALPGTLRLLSRTARAGDLTVETGAGASTVVLAAAGARHLAISPFVDEHDRIRAYCRTAGVNEAQLRFAVGRSDDVLPMLALERPLDLAFVDGRHSFPHPIVDIHYLGRWLRRGGVLIVDDVQIPAVGVAFRYLVTAPEWKLLAIPDDRAAAFRKVGEPDPDDNWHIQPFNRDHPDNSFLPWPRRLRRDAEERALRLRRRAGAAAPAMRRLRRQT